MITGLIPAAGEGSRWGGYAKEFLPVERGQTAFERCITALWHGGAGRFVIVSNPSKIAAHVERAMRGPAAKDTAFLIRHPPVGDLWQTVKSALPWCPDRVFFAMPDTLFPLHSFLKAAALDDHLSLGTFWTEQPGRFGVIQDNGRIIDKPSLSGVRRAWGLLVWDKAVTKLWEQLEAQNFAEAINRAMDEFGFATWQLDSYTDFASWEDYRGWMQGHSTNVIQTAHAP